MLLTVMGKSGDQVLAVSFAEFIASVEPRLRQSLVAAYGPVDGRSATVDALSWAWEHWERLGEIDNKVGYLYRVAQSSLRRTTTRSLPVEVLRQIEVVQPDVVPELMPALMRLSLQQRTVVVLVHAYGWSQADVATLLDVTPSTVREHLTRALNRLRTDLGETHVH